MLRRFAKAVLGPFMKHLAAGSDEMVRVMAERELHRRGWLPSGRHVSDAWAVSLVSLKINGVDWTERERRPLMSRWSGRLIGGPQVRVFLIETHAFLGTQRLTYPIVAVSIMAARSKGKIVELAWVTEKKPDDGRDVGRIPDGDIGLDKLNYFAATLDAMGEDNAQRIVERITMMREDMLASAEPEARAALTRVFDEVSDLPLD